MGWPLRNEPWPRKLSDKLRKELVAQFGIEPGRAVELRYVQGHGTFDGRPVLFVRIFDPLLDTDMDAIKHYEQAEGSCVMFEGWLEMDGTPSLKDVRQTAAGP